MIIPRHIAYLLWTLCLVMLAACSDQSNDPSIFYNLDEEFVIRPIEELSRDDNRLLLEISALHPNACDDAEIVYQYRLVDGISIIKLNDVISPNSCQSSEDPPSTTVALVPSNPIEYKLNITIKEIIENIGQISESADYYDFHMQTLNGIRVDHSRLNKIPTSAIWGAVDFAYQDSSFIAEQFMEEVLGHKKEYSWSPGYYGHFEMDAVGTLTSIEYPRQNNYRSICLMDSSVPLSNLSSIINRYRNQYPSFHFVLFNGYGESL